MFCTPKVPKVFIFVCVCVHQWLFFASQFDGTMFSPLSKFVTSLIQESNSHSQNRRIIHDGGWVLLFAKHPFSSDAKELYEEGKWLGTSLDVFTITCTGFYAVFIPDKATLWVSDNVDAMLEFSMLSFLKFPMPPTMSPKYWYTCSRNVEILEAVVHYCQALDIILVSRGYICAVVNDDSCTHIHWKISDIFLSEGSKREF